MQMQESKTAHDDKKTRARQETQEAVGPIDRLAVESSINKVRVARVALGTAKVPRPNFDLGADLQEVSREGNELTLKYALYLETTPYVQLVEIHGVAKVRSSMLDSRTDYDSLSEGLLTDVALEIFRNHYQTVYLLFDWMRLANPSPWIFDSVHLV